jgi:hypothetical protein
MKGKFSLVLTLLVMTGAMAYCSAAHALIEVERTVFGVQSGTMYPMRYGTQQGAADDVPFPPETTWPPGMTTGATLVPICALKGSQLRVTFTFVSAGEVIGFKVIATLNGCDATHWTHETGIIRYSSQNYVDLPALPNYVDLTSLSLDVWMYEDVGGTWQFNSLQTGVGKIYVVHAAPKALMTKPWGRVLDYSCQWACTQTTDANVAKRICTGLFFGGLFAYPSNTASYWTDPLDSTIFRLMKFLNAAQPVSGNCMDVSDFYMIATCTVGLDFSVRILEPDPPDSSGQFTSQPICLIGSDPTVDWTYTISRWAWHQTATRTGTVYDPTGAQKEDLSGDGYRNPPINWPLQGYWQTRDGGGVPILGLVADPVQNAGAPIAGATYKCSVSDVP